MAHDLEQYDGQTSFVYIGETPWHRLGHRIEHPMSIEEALELSRANYQVTAKSVFATTEFGTTIKVPGVVANVRYYGENAVVLGVVSDRYKILQNEEAFRFLDPLLEEGVKVETMGVLGHGEQAFACLRLPKGITIGGEDAVDLFMVAMNGHDGKTAFTIISTPVRVVCRNTLRMALGSTKSSWSIRHVKSLKGQIAEARRSLELSWSYASEFEKIASQLLSENMTDGEWITFREKLIHKPGSAYSRSEIQAEMDLDYLWSSASTQQNCRNTRWGAYNAFTEWVDHKMPVRGIRYSPAQQDVRDIRALTGDSDALKNKALALLTV